jgi:hypothetical protein
MLETTLRMGRDLGRTNIYAGQPNNGLSLFIENHPITYPSQWG